MKYKAAIFDLDGTLIDSLEDLADSANDTMTSFGFPTHTVEEYRYFVGNGPRKLMERCLPKEHSQDAKIIDEALSRYNACYKEHLFGKTRPYDGIMSMLEALREKDIPLGICTNKQQFASDAIVEKMFPSGMFRMNLGDMPGTPRKPDPTKTLQIVTAFGVKPQETAYLGDSSTDMENAINAGVFGVGVSWGFRPEQELVESGAKLIIHHPMEMLAKLDF